MIKVGIKTGPQDWFDRLRNSQASFCEVWYRVDQPRWYDEQFAYNTNQGIETGLHYWGVIDGHESNIAYPGPIRARSIAAIKACLEVAAKHSHVYVNIHAGNYRLIKIDLDTRVFAPDFSMPEAPLDEATHAQAESIQELTEYAHQCGVVLLVETVPAKLATGPVDIPSNRLKPQHQSAMPVDSLIKLAQKQEVSITNDLCHTFADQFDQPLNELKQALITKTATLAPYTRLLHINTVTPPYNGTDSHHGITPNDFSIEGIFPDFQTLTDILRMFNHRHDVWAICEPNSEHDQNYQILKNLVASL